MTALRLINNLPLISLLGKKVYGKICGQETQHEVVRFFPPAYVLQS